MTKDKAINTDKFIRSLAMRSGDKRYKQNPRNNVIAFRLSDHELELILQYFGNVGAMRDYAIKQIEAGKVPKLTEPDQEGIIVKIARRNSNGQDVIITPEI